MQFYKYQGTGNDFILFDNRTGDIGLTQAQIEQLCHRRFGIGADGLMLLNTHPELDFEMKYFNADGNPGSLCGNGSRCIIRFAHDLGIQKNKYIFLASDGPHEAELLSDNRISLHMNDVFQIQRTELGLFMNTGSPHLVKFVKTLNEVDIHADGKKLRHHPSFAPGGTNVNFVERTTNPAHIVVRTFERGVEDETYSCGTGVTACALAMAFTDQTIRDTTIDTKGGALAVTYDTLDFIRFENIRLIGPAERVFQGEINLS